MQIEYKRLTKNELDTFIEMRINQLREEGSKEDIDLRPALKDYYLRHLESRRTSPVQAEKSDCSQACSQILLTEEKESQGNF